MPPELLVTRSPLLLEAMCVAARRTPAEVENAKARIRGALHEGPIQQHVRRDALVLVERRGPGHLDLVAPLEAEAPGDRPLAEIRAADPRAVRKRRDERLEEPSRLRGSAEVSHMAREYG